MMLPTRFIERLQQIVPAAQFSDILATFKQPPLVGFRINTLKADHTVLSEFSHINLTPISWYKDAFLIDADKKSQLTNSEAYTNGKIYLQNLASMLPVLILDPKPGEEILDLAAAPGSKTTQIASLMQNCGRIAAVEKAKNRYFKLNNNLIQQGVTIADTYHKDGRLIWRHCKDRFDRVLLDAPCSSEARFNLNEPDSFAFWNEKKIQEMARNQWALLHSAWLSLKPGGILVYSTCSFAPEENEANIARLLKKYADKVEINFINLPLNNIQLGLTEWQGKKYPEIISRCIRILPDGVMSGFFICCLKKMPYYEKDAIPK